MKFSERKGFTSVRSAVQKESIDDPLKNMLWNILFTSYFEMIYRSFLPNKGSANHSFLLNLWIYYFKEKMDEIPGNKGELFKYIKSYFFKCPWFEVFDFLEFIIANTDPSGYQERQHLSMVINTLNSALKRELSAYRIIDGEVTEIISEEEISTIEESLSDFNPYKPVKEHLKTSLTLFSNRKQPDYRNSIKESISSVESLCSIITGNPNATLGQALKEIEKTTNLHPALKNAFNSLYGYTSDADGIRHKLLDEPNLTQEDAKFMLVSCSAFVNYLISLNT